MVMRPWQKFTLGILAAIMPLLSAYLLNQRQAQGNEERALAAYEVRRDSARAAERQQERAAHRPRSEPEASVLAGTKTDLDALADSAYAAADTTPVSVPPTTLGKLLGQRAKMIPAKALLKARRK
jgi:hypothetical protein